MQPYRRYHLSAYLEGIFCCGGPHESLVISACHRTRLRRNLQRTRARPAIAWSRTHRLRDVAHRTDADRVAPGYSRARLGRRPDLSLEPGSVYARGRLRRLSTALRP